LISVSIFSKSVTCQPGPDGGGNRID